MALGGQYELRDRVCISRQVSPQQEGETVLTCLEAWGRLLLPRDVRALLLLLLLLHSRLQAPTGRAKSQKPEGPSREDSPVRKEKISERKENNHETNNNNKRFDKTR